MSGGGIAASPISPFRGGSAGGREDEAVMGPPSSFAGDFDLEREMLFPLARRSQDGLDLGAGLILAKVRSELDAKEGEDARVDVVVGGSGTGLVTSAYDAERGEGRRDARFDTSIAETWSSLLSATHTMQVECCVKLR